MTTLELEARLDNLLSTAQEETASIDLFAPIQEREECPICLIPFPINNNEAKFRLCCGKMICDGCMYKELCTDAEKTKFDQSKPTGLCAFCRLPPVPGNTEIKCLRKLTKNKNPIAFIQLALKYQAGDRVIQSNTKALEMYIRAAELGNSQGYTYIGQCYQEGLAVEQNLSKAFEFYEVSAKKGDYEAHKYLAKLHGRNDDFEKSVEHVKAAASAGDKDSMDMLMGAYKHKLLPKDDLTITLRAFHASSYEMKSKDRDDARLFEEMLRQRGRE